MRFASKPLKCCLCVSEDKLSVCEDSVVSVGFIFPKCISVTIESHLKTLPNAGPLPQIYVAILQELNTIQNILNSNSLVLSNEFTSQLYMQLVTLSHSKPIGMCKLEQ